MTRTRIVRWLRVLLPLLALVLLSTLFLFSRQSGTESQIPYAEVDAESMARDPRMVAPQYSGVTDDGAQIRLEASQAEIGNARGGKDLRLDWQRPDGLKADLTAPAAGVEGDTIQLRGGVQMTTSSGWTVDADQIDAATNRSQITANDGVEARAPFGQITAQQMELKPKGETGEHDGDAILNFSGGVRLIYQP
ncbi:hypothetical protein H4P12_07185 [Paracoccus sp. 11-3]|uniref:Lipopolysaccharide export system protein LptC n=1 Tax=Paracoccus amoyensis TaxID=2760093 RepID=A0A926G8M1_9RHOB|nr:hypothetical protein [Paracoccus amoyensis]MBC9246498.1 hypothetical protein [Paracoccus amoyensis]